MSAEIEALKAENARLVAWLESNRIQWRLADQCDSKQAQSVEPSETVRLSTAEKIALFRRLFLGCSDVFPVRWKSKSSGKSGC